MASVATAASSSKEDDTWAREYLLDPLNPVEAWQTAQVGGQYNNKIPTQHQQKSKFSLLGRSKSQHVPNPKPNSNSSNSTNLGRSRSQHVPNPRAGPVSRENERPNSNRQPPRQPMVRHHSSGESFEYEAKKGPPPPRHPHHGGPPRPRHHVPRSSGRVPADLIDSLDTSVFGVPYHHEGPFDATLAARNRKPWSSPLEATKYGNSLALKATSKADIENSLAMGRPLDGVALFPPGAVVPGGEIMPDYEEYDLHRKDGNFRRFHGGKYRDEDLKGKGMVGYDGDLHEKQMKAAQKAHKRGKSMQPSKDTYEMQDRERDRDSGSGADRPKSSTADNDGPGLSASGSGLRRGGSTAGRLEGVGARIKRRFSLRKSKASGNADA